MGRGPSQEYHKNMAEGYVKGTLTCLTAETIKKEINTDFPLVLNIEPTNACNLSCYVCPRNISNRKIGFMNYELYKKIIHECLNYKKLRMINFHKDGEPFLHSRLIDMIRYAKDKEVAKILHLNTNAVLLDEKIVRDFLTSGIDDVTISLDAFFPETFKKIKGKDFLDVVNRNVENLFNLKQKLKLDIPFIRVKIMEYEDTYEEIKKFIEKWENVADDVQVTGIHNWGGSINVKVTDEINVKSKRFPCILLWYALAVNWDGSVSICNLDWNLSGSLYNCNENLLSDIWNSDKLKKIRKNHLDSNFDFINACKECVVWAGGENMLDWLKEKKEFYDTIK